MPNVKSYKLYLSLLFKIYYFGMLGLFILIVLGIIISDIFIFREHNGPPWFAGVFMMIGTVPFLFWILSFPHTIIVREYNEVTFKGVLRSRTVSISEIISIKPDTTMFFGFLVVKTKAKKIKILNQFTGFSEFISSLKEKNPTIELLGC